MSRILIRHSCCAGAGDDMKQEESKDFVTKEFAVSDDTVALVTDFAEESMSEQDVPMKTIYAFNVVIDELVSNICNYSGASEMSAGLCITENDISMRFVDNGDPFDPEEIEDPDLALSVEERGIGGLGIFMVRQMMDSFEYEYSDGKNISVIKKAR